MSRSSCVQGARIELLLAMTVAPVSMLAQPITPAVALQEAQASEPEAEQLSPGQKMNSRYPQPIRGRFSARSVGTGGRRYRARLRGGAGLRSRAG